MTREQAIKILGKHVWPVSHPNGPAAQWVDALSELGMLKLDEPKSAWDRFKEAFVGEYDYVNDDTIPNSTLGEMKRTLEKLNLKIVEK